MSNKDLLPEDSATQSSFVFCTIQQKRPLSIWCCFFSLQSDFFCFLASIKDQYNGPRPEAFSLISLSLNSKLFALLKPFKGIALLAYVAIVYLLDSIYFQILPKVPFS